MRWSKTTFAPFTLPFLHTLLHTAVRNLSSPLYEPLSTTFAPSVHPARSKGADGLKESCERESARYRSVMVSGPKARKSTYFASGA